MALATKDNRTPAPISGAPRKPASRHRFVEAAARDEFRLMFQPIVEIGTGRVAGCEALVRWDCAEWTELGPEWFIPEAEECGGIVPLGEWVLRVACERLDEWYEAGCNDANLSINVSVRQLESSDLAGRVAEVIKACSFEAHQLTLELTETMCTSSALTVGAQIRRLHDMGVRLSVDDFGTGYSTLELVRDFPIDEIKIDRWFTARVLQSKKAREIVRMAVDMASAVGSTAIVEGISGSRVRDSVLALGARYGQGFWYSKPCDCAKMWSMWRMNQVGNEGTE